MRTALQTIAIGALVSAMVLCFSLVKLVEDLDHIARDTAPKFETALDQMVLASSNVTAATRTLSEASAAEKDNWTKTSKEAAKTGAAVRLFVDKLDRQLNDKTLPNFDAQLSALSSQSQLAVKQAGDAAEQLGFAAEQLAITAQSLDGTVSNPNIASSLQQISEATQQIAQASGHANKILADGEKVADHYEAEIMKPVSLARKLGEYVLSFGSDARVLFTGGK